MESLGLLPSLLGARAYDEIGARLGHVADVLFPVGSPHPEWLLLVLLRAADRFVLVPARGVRHHHGGIDLPLPRALVRTAPTTAGPPNELTALHAERLSLHYAVAHSDGPWEGLVEPALGIVDDRVRMVG